MTSTATTPEEYIASLPADRQEAIIAVRETILANLPSGFEEGMQYGHIGYFVPHSRYPNGYHCDPKQPLPVYCLGSQKNHMAVYMFCVYCNPQLSEQFREDYLATGKKLDMGASCVRFKKLENLPLELIGKTIANIKVDDFIQGYEASIPPSKRKK